MHCDTYRNGELAYINNSEQFVGSQDSERGNVTCTVSVVVSVSSRAVNAVRIVHSWEMSSEFPKKTRHCRQNVPNIFYTSAKMVSRLTVI